MMRLIRQITVYSPSCLGKKDVLLSGDKIEAVADHIRLDTDLPVDIISGNGLYLFPGFIDAHVHIAGGGGEAGFSSRTPEIMLSAITTAGVTTVIGTLGTDGTTRTMTNLLAKANALEEEGITAFIQSGSYQLPLKTLTGSITEDLLLIEKVIGAGEIAISDHRSSHPTFDELSRLAADVRLGAMLAGKSGIINVHMGDSKKMLHLIEEIIAQTEIPMRHFVPTHMNRNPYLFEASMKYASGGGNVDFTTSTVPIFIEEGEIPAYHTLKLYKDKQIPLSKVTFSSDGQGSLPIFDPSGELTGCEVGKISSLYQAVRDAILIDNIPVEEALAVITSNVAEIYGLHHKGRIAGGMDADLVLVDQNTLEIRSVIAKNRLVVENSHVLVRGVYE